MGRHEARQVAEGHLKTQMGKREDEREAAAPTHRFPAGGHNGRPLVTTGWPSGTSRGRHHVPSEKAGSICYVENGKSLHFHCQLLEAKLYKVLLVTVTRTALGPLVSATQLRTRAQTQTAVG